MKCLVITGVSKRTLDDIVKRIIKTIELRSAHNVVTAFKAAEGSNVFLTTSKLHDIDKGTVGIIAEVVKKEITSHSLIFASEIQESEMTVIKLKLNVKGLGRIVKVYNTDILGITEAEVIEVNYFNAR
ncbi:MAG TPA: DUF473 domain-containing protein [Archaeoglobus profundus]|nr:DUF473 domain-containing protein [Archaeoglobus profundus]